MLFWHGVDFWVLIFGQKARGCECLNEMKKLKMKKKRTEKEGREIVYVCLKSWPLASESLLHEKQGNIKRMSFMT